LAILLLLFFAKDTSGQERLDALRENPALQGRDHNDDSQRRTSLSLPFFDDFYPLDIYPDTEFWEDDLVYVNATFPVEPPTIGVATFDGLNANGEPYSLLPDDHGPADMLTSLPIDLAGLSGGESVYISFYWQPGGLGDEPEFEEGDFENQDVLMLEFRDTAGNWDTLWVQQGDTMQPFRQEFVQITDDKYFYDEFQFRFRAVGRLTGAFDHWHLDYVRLDRNRDPEIEQNIAEMAYQYWPSPLLTPYYAMPYMHFDSSYTADTHTVFIRNNFNQVSTDIIDFYLARELSTGSVLDNYAGPSRDLGPLISFKEHYDSFSIPEEIDEDTVTVRVTYRFLVSAEDTSNEVTNRNNTVVKDQVFSNFFAYDDASAEKAYILEVRINDALYGQVALDYFAPVADTLQAVRLHFVNFNEDIGNTRFALLVWKELATDTTDEEILYREDYIRVDDLLTGDSLSRINGFTYVPIKPEYIIGEEEKLIVEGRFYIGFEIDVNVFLPIGFDLNTDGSGFHYINLGQGWSPTQFDGSLMMNPVVGHPLPPRFVTSANEQVLQSLGITLFPNPAPRRLNIHSEVMNGVLRVTDIAGRRVLERKFSRNDYVDTQSLYPGVYILRITDLDTGLQGSAGFIRP
jgi:hypothetical protein